MTYLLYGSYNRTVLTLVDLRRPHHFVALVGLTIPSLSMSGCNSSPSVRGADAVAVVRLRLGWD